MELADNKKQKKEGKTPKSPKYAAPAIDPKGKGKGKDGKGKGKTKTKTKTQFDNSVGKKIIFRDQTNLLNAQDHGVAQRQM